LGIIRNQIVSIIMTGNSKYEILLLPYICLDTAQSLNIFAINNVCEMFLLPSEGALWLSALFLCLNTSIIRTFSQILKRTCLCIIPLAIITSEQGRSKGIVRPVPSFLPCSSARSYPSVRQCVSTCYVIQCRTYYVKCVLCESRALLRETS